MADLKDDSKKEEEEYGGFEPEDDDDESFMLGDENEYPAKLPDSFGDKPEPVITNAQTPESKPDEGTQAENTGNNTPEDVPELEETQAVEEVDEEPTPETEANGEELDDEFKNKLLEDIEKSKSKRGTEESLPVAESAKQIGDDADTVVSLNDIEADKPSNSGIGEASESTESTNQPVASAIPIDNKPPIINKPPVIEEEPREKKKRPIWLLMLYTAAATFLLTMGLMLLVWNTWLDDNTPKKLPKTTDLAKTKTNYEDSSKQLSSKTNVSKDEEAWLDSMKAKDKDSALASNEQKDKFSALEDKTTKQEKPKNNPAKIEKPAKKESNKKVAPKKKDDLASNDVAHKVKEKPKETSPKIDESQFAMPQPNGPAPEKGIFTVQIYSSPSKEDAESWLGQLKARQIEGAMISEQEIKGRTWYRVRFGKFETKEEARSSAIKLGYSQSWIDRIK